MFSRILSAALLSSLLLNAFVAPTYAAQSKTYTLNSSSVFNYNIDGVIPIAGSDVKPWYDAAWKYRYQIIVNHELVMEELTNFPLLLRLNDLNLGEAREDRYDVLVTAADGVSKLAYEREDKNTLWVKVPTLSATEPTVLYLYFGNADAEDQQDAENVWDEEFTTIYHLNQEPGLRVQDAKNDNDATAFGGLEPTGNYDAGIAGPAVRLNGTSQFLRPVTKNWFRQRNFTLSLWVNLDQFVGGDENYIFDLQTPRTAVHMTSGSGDGPLGSAIRVNLAGTSLGLQNIETTREALTITGAWHHILVQCHESLGRAEVWVNGSLRGNTSLTCSNTSSSGNIALGARHDGTRGFDGLLDEVRFINSPRSTAWIKTEYFSQCDCEDFLNTADVAEQYASEDFTADRVAMIALKPDRPLSFTSLSSFRPNASDQITYQLSNNGGKTWLFYTKDGWKGANPSNPHHRSSANDIHAHLSSFPTGEGKLLWRAYLPSGTSLDSIKIDYLPGPAAGTSALLTGAKSPATSLQDFRVQSLNTLFRSAFDRSPTPGEWTHWVTRMLSEGKPLDAWLGAMEWAAQ